MHSAQTVYYSDVFWASLILIFQGNDFIASDDNKTAVLLSKVWDLHGLFYIEILLLVFAACKKILITVRYFLS